MPLPGDVKQIALQPGQFAWCRDEKSGSLSLYVGPTRLTPTDDDVFLMQSEDGELTPVESIREAVQPFIMIRPGEYAVVHNPVANSTPDRPNGAFSSAAARFKGAKIMFSPKQASCLFHSGKIKPIRNEKSSRAF